MNNFESIFSEIMFDNASIKIFSKKEQKLKAKLLKTKSLIIAGLPHTQGTQGIFKLKKISGNFDLFFKLRETQ